MNKERRKAIEEAKEQLDALRGVIEELRDEEQDYFDNMPESFQQGEKGQAAETAIYALDAAGSSLDEAISSLEEAVQ